MYGEHYVLLSVLLKGDSLSYHLGMHFSTKDQDNDNGVDNTASDRQRDCANEEKGGWWYRNCSKANLNGLYLYGDTSHLGPKEKYQGMTWADWKGNEYSLESVKMMIREHNPPL